jgi:hypothetical protein
MAILYVKTIMYSTSCILRAHHCADPPGREEKDTEPQGCPEPTRSPTDRFDPTAQLPAGKTPCSRRPDQPPPSAGSTDRIGGPSLG